MNNRDERRIIEGGDRGTEMAQRARKIPLIEQLVWGPPDSNRRFNQVAVRRIPSRLAVVPRVAEDFMLAVGVCMGLMLYVAVSGQ